MYLETNLRLKIITNGNVISAMLKCLFTYYFFFADLSISATLSGIFRFKVSGSIKDSKPAMVATIPNMIAGIPACMAPCKWMV